MNTIQSQFLYKAWANEELFSLLSTLSEIDLKDELHLASRILNHIYVVDDLFKAQLTSAAHSYKSTNTEETPELNVLREKVSNMDSWYMSFAEGLTESELDTSLNFTFVDGDSGRMSIREILSHIIIHGAYHRGAVGRILAASSIAPPRDIFTRFLHETEPQRRKG